MQMMVDEAGPPRIGGSMQAGPETARACARASSENTRRRGHSRSRKSRAAPGGIQGPLQRSVP